MQLNKKEISLIFLLIMIAILRSLFFIPKAPNYKNVVGEKVQFEGIVDDDPDIRLKNKHLNIKIGKDVTILTIVGREVEVSYGDKVKVKGVLEEPENFITNSGKEFNYKRYLANQDIYYMIKNPDLKIISHNNGNALKSVLYKFRNSFIKNINKMISMPESDLANGLILGVKGGFDEDTKNEFVSTGTIHIVALSGYNVSIVSLGVMKVLRVIFSQSISIVFGMIVIVLFVIMTGASATAVRAGIMAVIMLIGRMTNRKYLAGRALVIAALLMVAYDPRILWDISFQLSFIATGGVLYVTPKVYEWFKFLSLNLGIRELVSSTVAATIAVLPILLYLTGVFSVVSIPTNLLILIFIPIAMFLIFLTGVFGYIIPFLSMISGYFSYLILHYILGVIHIFGTFSFASFTIQRFPLFLAILIYIFLIWWVFGNKKEDF